MVEHCFCLLHVVEIAVQLLFPTVSAQSWFLLLFAHCGRCCLLLAAALCNSINVPCAAK